MSREERLARYCALVAGLTAAASFAAHVLGLTLPSLLPERGMADPRVAFMLCAAALSLALANARDALPRLVAVIGALLLTLGSLLRLHVFGEGGEPALLSTGSDATTLSAALLGFALLTLPSASSALRLLSWWLAALSCLVPYNALNTWLINPALGVEPSSFGGMPMSTALVLLILAAGALLANPVWRPLRYFSSTGPEGQIVRRLLPVTVLVPLLLGVLAAHALQAGLLDTAYMLGALVTMLSVVTSLSVWTFAGSLRRVDRAREEALEQLEQAKTSLEERVHNATLGLAQANRALLAQVQATRAAQREFETLFFSAPDAIVVVRPNGEIEMANDRACTLFGYTRSQFLELRIEDLIPVSFRSSHVLLRENYLQDPTPRTMNRNRQTRAQRRDGSTLLVEINLSPLGPGARPDVIAVIRDVTDLHRARESLALSEMRFLETLQSAPIGMAIFDLDGAWLEVNDAFCRIVGRPREEVMKVAFSEVTHPDDLLIDKPLIKQLWRGEVPSYQIERRYVQPSGNVVWGLVQVTLLRDAQGRRLQYIAQVVDISALKATEQALIDSRARLQRVLEGSNDGFWDWDIGSDVLSFSDRLEHILGYASGELGGEFRIFDLQSVHVDDRAELQRRLDAHLLGFSERLQVEFRTRNRDGKWIWIMVRGKVYERNEADKPLRIAGTYSDVTEHHDLEENLLRRTRDLEASNKELEQFAYAASHDLQEPLRKVTSFVQLFARRYRDKVDDTAQEYIDIVVEGAQRMKTLIDDLLRYSRLTGGENVFTAVDLGAVVGGVLKDLELQIGEAGVTLDVGRLPVVQGDATQLRALFQNLISNAVKFRSAERPIVEICCSTDDKQHTVSISDNGIGIDPRYFERIFVLFQRLHTRSEYSGTGIGLAICKRIVERHGGRIWVASSAGAGSTFYFTLPVRGELGARALDS